MSACIEIHIPTPLSTLPQRLLGSLLPLAAMAYLFPSRFHSRALQLEGDNEEGRIDHCSRWALKLKSQSNISFWQRQISQFLVLFSSAMEEIGLWLRSAYLSALFTPMLLSAPLVFYFELGGAGGRAIWMDLVLWTIERAGKACYF